MKAIFEDIAALLAAGEDIAVATVVQTRGSTPREIGAKMVVRPSGSIIGTVGGGCGEAEVWRTAVEVIHTRKPRTVEVDLTQEISMQSDGVCGGIMDVFVEAWWTGGSSAERSPARQDGGASPLDITQALVSAEKERKPVALATVVHCRGEAWLEDGAKMVVFGDGTALGSFGQPDLDDIILDAALKALSTGEPGVVRTRSGKDGQEIGKTVPDVEVFVEPFKPQPTLLIAGAGHIAVPLAKIGKMLDLHVAVVDDRASFANEERFPEIDQIIVSDFETALSDFPITSDTYIVLITRGHQHDVVSLKQVIDSPAAYIGMIGSKRRVFAVFKLLHEEGMSLDKLARVHSPIGVDLAAETPAEIALSISAEVVKVMRGGKATSLSEATRERYLRLLQKGEELD
ncbi:MAG: XdhC family protein [Chloroflexi bacterium]|nr:XdhC family protein [Chloroflexota bacterium]